MSGYIILFLAFFIFSFIKNRNASLIMMFILIFVFSAIRYKIGHDYQGYLNLILNNGHDNFFRLEQLELFSRILLILAQKYYVFLFFILSSFITIFIFWYVIKKFSINPKLSLFLYITLPFFMVLNFSIIRNGLAFSFVFLGITMFKNSTLKQLLCIICAFLFHQSASLALIILLPWDKINNVNILWAIFISSFLINILFVETIIEYFPKYYIIERFIYYLDKSKVQQQGGSIIKYLVFIINILHLLKYKSFIKINEDYKYYIPLICIGASFYAFFQSYSHIAMRFCVYFYCLLLLTLPELLKIYRIPKSAGYVIGIVIFLFYIINMHLGTYDPNTGISPVFPYRTIFSI